MARCDVCGNEDRRTMTIRMTDGDRQFEGVFDSFECAIAFFAPSCARCGCRVIGHGVEVDGTMYCCAHCAGELVKTGPREHDLGGGKGRIFG